MRHVGDAKDEVRYIGHAPLGERSNVNAALPLRTIVAFSSSFSADGPPDSGKKVVHERMAVLRNCDSVARCRFTAKGTLKPFSGAP